MLRHIGFVWVMVRRWLEREGRVWALRDFQGILDFM